LSTDDVLAHLDKRLQGARLQIVHDHLDTCGACRVVMAEAARIATNGDRGSRQPRTLADGEGVAGRYEIRRFMARGGMGEVYEALDSALGEVVALKTLAVTAVDKTDAVKRLLAEVRIARKVTHPNVCRILEFGTHQREGSADQPVPFLTMPLLQGETLARRIERTGRLPPAEALRILMQLAAGLTAVHEVGVVHRDFKSDNVFMVAGAGGEERAVVMDFGLARALEAPGDGKKSTGGLLLGTPAYMAPEQVEGKAITKAVDVYALGVVAFELITGRVPFVAESAAAVALARLRYAVDPPSSLVAGLDKAWDAFVRRCLKRGPEQRFADMKELRVALDRLQGGGRRASWRHAAVPLLAGAAAVIGFRTVTTLTTPDRGPLQVNGVVHERTGASSPTSSASPPERLGLREFQGFGPLSISGRPDASRRKLTLRRPVIERGAPAVSSGSPLPSPAGAASKPPPPSPSPFAEPTRSRTRQPDDLVDPF
jgi:serine/threonine protein kinase